MDLLAIVQARMGASRLPGKVLLEIEGKKVLQHVVERVRRSSAIEDIVVATTLSESDLAIARLCAEIGVGVYRGSENDVLDRYYQAARSFEARHIVRITSDCPLIDPAIIDMVVACHLEGGFDYTSNVIKETFPDGEDVEVFTIGALENAWKNAGLGSEREHVTPYIRNHPEIFNLKNVEWEHDLSGMRWTLDEKADYEFIKMVYGGLYKKKPDFGMKDIIELLMEKPGIFALNSGIGRNEGYHSSVKKDNATNKAG